MADENGVRIYGDEEGIRAFPEADEVFASEVERHSEFLLPLATIDVDRFIPGESGVIHLLIPIEPLEGALGEETPEEFQTWCCAEDWLGYRMLDNKCELMADFRYFELERLRHEPPEDSDSHEELKEYYESARTAFEEHRQFFRKHGWLSAHPSNPETLDDDSDSRRSIIGEFGGISRDGNWSCNGNGIPSRFSYFPDATEHGEDAALPRTEDGRDFIFVGSVEVYYFLNDTNAYLMLFFDPVERIVLTVSGWT